jgi:hypothetical protein
MRRAIALGIVGLGLMVVPSAARRSSGLPASTLTPNAVAFADQLHGILGTGWQGCEYGHPRCPVGGTISTTSNGGKTWSVVRRTPRPVVFATYYRRGKYYVQLDDGATLLGSGEHWRPADGGHNWHALPKVSRPEEDFGSWAYVVPHGGVGYAVHAIGGSEKRRLIETTDAGRTWHVVRRWG